jgi:hypothetical protein
MRRPKRRDLVNGAVAMINQKMIAVVAVLLNCRWLFHAVFSRAKENRPQKAAGIQSQRKKNGRASGRFFRLLTKGD